MIRLVLVYFISFFIIFKSFFIINYINKNDSQNIKNDLKRKIIIAFIVSLVNILIYLRVDLSFEFFSYSMLIFFITIIAYIDYYTKYVYEIIAIPMLITSSIIYIINIILGNSDVESFIVILLTSIILIIFSKLNYMGEGDVEIFIALFLVINKYMMLPIIHVIFSFGISGIIGIFLLVIRRVPLNHRKPLCPSIAVATYILLILI